MNNTIIEFFIKILNNLILSSGFNFILFSKFSKIASENYINSISYICGMAKKRDDYDIIIIGGGLAGLACATNISDTHKSLKMAVISKIHPLRSQTVMAQGGINAAIGKDDSVKRHFYDTIKHSEFLADQEKVDSFVKEAPQAIEELEKFGAMFTRKEGGEIDQRSVAGKAYTTQRDYVNESFPRTCYAADRTGQMLLYTMYEQVKKRGITVMEDCFVMSLVMSENACVGVVVYDLRRGEIYPVKSYTTILCNGGYGAVYKNTTNSAFSTGDGQAAVLRAGGHLMDMEFVQFHPTSVAGKNIMIMDCVRAEGGYLINGAGERFMQAYTKRLMEHAPNDIVTRAITNEISHKRGINRNSYVFLDLRHLGEEEIEKKLHNVREMCIKNLGIDPVKHPIPVEPAQHYSLGGIPTDINGATAIQGLYAAGECACVNLHGANRLGGNALLESFVFGKRAGSAAADYIEAMREEKLFKPFPENAENSELDYVMKLKQRAGGESWSEIKNQLKKLMTDSAGVFREEGKLINALKEVQDLQKRLNDVVVADKGNSYNTEVVEVLELRNMLDVCEAIVAGALAREESRGSHFRTDFPEKRNLKYLKHTLIRRTADGLKLSYKDVNISHFKPES